jgi:hypothetical protein
LFDRKRRAHRNLNPLSNQSATDNFNSMTDTLDIERITEKGENR